MNKILLTTIIILLSQNSLACSIALSTKKFEITGEETKNPITPDFSLSSIRRGHSGFNGDCSDLGFVVLKLATVPKTSQGYFFEMVEGKFESQLFQQGPLTGISKKNDTYTFVWLDGHSNSQEPFNIRVRITAVSRSGKKSNSQYLQITHPGIKIPWWNIWKRLPYLRNF